MTIGYGPLYRVEGPPPLKPLYGLLQAADAPAAGVRIVPEGDEHWLNGIEVWPFPSTPGSTFDSSAVGSSAQTKGVGTDPARPQFGPMTVYVPVQCTTLRLHDANVFRARALAVLDAVESSLVAEEFVTGNTIGLNPHLADGNGTFPNGDTATSVANGIALLEGEIAKSGRQGLIHMSPVALTAAGNGYLIRDTGTGVLRTLKGTVVIPDDGYVAVHGAGGPQGHAPATGTQEWIYASGPVDVRRSEPFVIPDDLTRALDRATNTVTFRAERHYIVDWDAAVQAAVRVDVCRTTC